MVSLKELKPVAEALNDKSNSINEIITDLNAKLAKLNIGIEVEGPVLHSSGWNYERDADDQVISRDRVVSCLGYAKMNDQWQLALGEYEERQGGGDTEYSNTTFVPLLQATRAMRVQALAAVEQLITILKVRAESEIKTIDKARELANRI